MKRIYIKPVTDKIPCSMVNIMAASPENTWNSQLGDDEKQPITEDEPNPGNETKDMLDGSYSPWED